MPDAVNAVVQVENGPCHFLLMVNVKTRDEQKWRALLAASSKSYVFRQAKAFCKLRSSLRH